MAKKARVTRHTSDYDPNFTATGEPRKIYHAPTPGQRLKMQRKEREARKEAAQLAQNGMAGKLSVIEKPDKSKLRRYHIWLSTEQIEWISEKAFHEGTKRSEWVRRVLDALRMADMGGLPGNGKE